MRYYPLFVLYSLKMSFQWLLVCLASDENSAVTLTFIFICIKCVFPLVAFKIFFSDYVVGVDFIKFKKCLAIIFSNIFSLSFPIMDLNDMYNIRLLKLFCCYIMLYWFIFPPMIYFGDFLFHTFKFIKCFSVVSDLLLFHSEYFSSQTLHLLLVEIQFICLISFPNMHILSFNFLNK